MPDKELDIKINVEADIAAATEAVESLKDLGSAAKTAGSEASGSASGMTRLEEAAAGAATATEKTATSSKSAARALGELKNAGVGGRQILEGIRIASEGGISGILGMASAVRGLITIVRSGVISTGPIGLLVVALGTLAGLFLSLTSRSHEAAAGLNKTGSSADALKKKLGELEDEAKKSLEAQLAAVEELNEGYRELLALMDDARDRAKALAEVQAELERAKMNLAEQRQLAGAKTDDERAKISESFAKKRETFDQGWKSDSFSEDTEFAKERIKKAQEEQRVLQAERDADEARVAAARKAFEETKAESTRATKEAMVTSGVLGGKGVSPVDALDAPWNFLRGGRPALGREDPEVLKKFEEARKASGTAQEAKKELDLAEEAAAANATKLGQGFATTNAELVKFGAMLERLSVQQKTESVTSQAEQVKESTTAKIEKEKTDKVADEKIAKLKDVAQGAMESGDFRTQDIAVAQIKDINKSRKAAPAPVPAETPAGGESTGTGGETPSGSPSSGAGSAAPAPAAPTRVESPVQVQSSTPASTGSTGDPDSPKGESIAGGMRATQKAIAQGMESTGADVEGGFQPGGGFIPLPRGGAAGGAAGGAGGAESLKVLKDIRDELKRLVEMSRSGGTGIASVFESSNQQIRDLAKKADITSRQVQNLQ